MLKYINEAPIVLYSIYKVYLDKTYSFIYNPSDKYVKRLKEKPVITSIYEHISAPILCMTHIINNIYLGNAYNAANYKYLIDNDIKCIVNATSEITNYFDKDNSFTYMKLSDVLDDSNSSLKKYFNDFINFIKDNKDSNILIHCFMGSSRSAALVVLYLIHFEMFNLNNAIKYVEKKCERVNINIIYINELKEFVSKKNS